MAGVRIEHFEVVRQLGEGGMGQVFLARDTRLDRDVAIKLIAPQYGGMEQAVARFAREARAASALNHPNILTIFEIGTWQGRPFMATELVDGESLQERLESGRIPSKTAVAIAGQVAAALGAAHAAGILHRDIKPGNIMLRSDGGVKVVDFGLAKLEQEQASGDSDAQTATLTRHGAVVGTAAYMSPEQARGEEVDGRSDLFSLGAVLYEMLGGSSPFRRDAIGSTYDAVLNHSPPPLAERLSLNHETDWIVGRALEKDRELRFQSAADFKSALDRLGSDLHSSSSVSGGSRRPKRDPAARQETSGRSDIRWQQVLLGMLAASVLAVLLVASGVLPPKDPEDPFLDLRSVRFTQLTEDVGNERFPSLSFDGKLVVYQGDSEGVWDIYLQRASGGVPINLTEGSSTDDLHPAFSPDGERIAFRSERLGGGIFIMGATGEDVRRLTDFGFHPSWSPDGKSLVVCDERVVDPGARGFDSRLFVVDVPSGESRHLPARDAVQPVWSPDGRRIAFWGIHRGGQRDLWTIPVGGGEPVQVTEDSALDWSPVWAPDSRHLFFASDRFGSMALHRVAIGEDGGAAGPVELVPTPSFNSYNASLTSAGDRIAFVAEVSQVQLLSYPYDPRTSAVGQATRLARGSRVYRNPAISPDGKRVVVDSTGAIQEDLYLLDRGRIRRLTDDPAKDRAPRWIDDENIVFFSDRRGDWQAFRVRADGSGLEQLTDYAEGGAQAPVPLHDGTQVIVNRSVYVSEFIDTQTHEVVGDLAEWGAAFTGAAGDGPIPFVWDVSSNDQILAFNGHIYVGPQSGPARAMLPGSDRPLWLPGAESFLYRSPDQRSLWKRTTEGADELVLSFSPDRLQGFSVSRDGQSIVTASQSNSSDIWMLTAE